MARVDLKNASPARVHPPGPALQRPRAVSHRPRLQPAAAWSHRASDRSPVCEPDRACALRARKTPSCCRC